MAPESEEVVVEKPMTMSQLLCAMNLPYVKRWQAHRVQNIISVADHSLRATFIYYYLGGKEIMAMLSHDLEEAITGDLPSPTKKYLQGMDFFKKLRIPFIDEKEQKLGKVCDKLELIFHLREQLEDNDHLPKKLQRIYDVEMEAIEKLSEEIGKLTEVKKLISQSKDFNVAKILKELEEANGNKS